MSARVKMKYGKYGSILSCLGGRVYQYITGDDTAGCFVHCPQRALEPDLTEFLGQKDLVPGVQNDGSYPLGEVVFPHLADKFRFPFLVFYPSRWVHAINF